MMLLLILKYVPYVGDSKGAMDEYTSEIFMGGQSTIVLHNTCEDSLLVAPIILDLVLLAKLRTRIQLKAEGEVCFFLVLMGPDPPSSCFRPPLFLLLDLSVKWYDNDDSKGVQFLQGKFRFFHPVATILNSLQLLLPCLGLF